jgi:hypothetical protein
MVPLRLAAWINTRLHIPRELQPYPFSHPIGPGPRFNAYQNHSSKCSPQRFLELSGITQLPIPCPDHDLTGMHLMHTAPDHSPTYPQLEPPSHKSSISALRSWIQNAATEAPPGCSCNLFPVPPKTFSPAPRPRGRRLCVTSLQIFVDELLDGNTSRRFRRLRRSLKRIWQMQRQSIRDVIDLLPIAYKPC